MPANEAVVGSSTRAVSYHAGKGVFIMESQLTSPAFPSPFARVAIYGISAANEYKLYDVNIHNSQACGNIVF
jgi:hypothetical protein